VFNPLASPNASEDVPLFVLPIRRNEDRNGPANHLFSLVPKEPFGAPVECRNDPVEVFAKDCIIGGIDHSRENAVCLFEFALLLMEFCKNNPPAKLLKSPLAEVKSYDGVKFIAQDGTWLMLRGSGTEPILRIYAEARSDADAEKLLKAGVKLTTQV